MTDKQGLSLVVYYSNSGHTRAVAEKIADGLCADIQEIRLSRAKGLPIFFMLRAVWGIIRRASWPVVNEPAPLNGYRLLVVGSPIWGGRMAPPVRGWLKDNRLPRDARLAAFFTVSGVTPPHAFEEVERIAGRELSATLSVNDKDRKADRVDGEVQAFVAKLGAGDPDRLSADTATGAERRSFE